MKKRNGFFSFSIVTVALLALSLSLKAASLAWKHFQMARTYEETVRLTYLAESALHEGWDQLCRHPDDFLQGRPIPVPQAEGLASQGEQLSVRCRYQPAGAVAGGFLKAQAAVPDSAVQQTCGLRFEVRADEQGRPVLHRCQYVN